MRRVPTAGIKTPKACPLLASALNAQLDLIAFVVKQFIEEAINVGHFLSRRFEQIKQRWGL